MDNQPKIVMYSTKWCGDCVRSKALLKKLNVEFSPMFEKSELTLENFESYGSSITKIAKKAYENKMMLCLETNLDGNELTEVLKYLDNPSISVVYDTGNRIALGHDLSKDIKFPSN